MKLEQIPEGRKNYLTSEKTQLLDVLKDLDKDNVFITSLIAPGLILIVNGYLSEKLTVPESFNKEIFLEECQLVKDILDKRYGG